MGLFKYIVFFGVLIVGVPVGFVMSRKNPLVEKIVFFLMIFFTSRLHETINFVSRETYRGTSRGFEITLVDLATLIIFFLVLSRAGQYKIKLLPPGSLLYFIYFMFSLISIMNAGIALYSWFEIWKMVRMYFFFWALYNYIQEFEQLNLLAKYMSFVIIYIFFEVINQKYLKGIYQTNGPFPHQNSLVMYMIVFNSIMLAKLLEFDRDMKSVLYTLGIFGIGSLCIIFTLSRAGMACYALSIVIIFALSYLSGFKFKNVALTALMMILGIAVLAASLDSIIRRIETAPEQSKQSRIELGHGAIRMAQDKTFGVGLNNFGLKINDPYPYGDHIDRPTPDFKEGLVETTYLMIAAETGWINLGIFLVFIFTFYIKNLINYFRYRKSEYRFIALGLIGGLAGIYLESCLEWVLKQTNNFYQLMIVFAIIGAMTKMIKQQKKQQAAENVGIS